MAHRQERRSPELTQSYTPKHRLERITKCAPEPFLSGANKQTFYRWKAKYAGLEVDEVRKMAQLQEENMRLKQLVAELTLDKTMLQDVLSKKW